MRMEDSDDDDNNFTPGDIGFIGGCLVINTIFLQCNSFHLIAHPESSKSRVFHVNSSI